MTKNYKKIFISHAQKDFKLVKQFITNIIESGIGVHPQDIFCSSIQAQGIEPGIEFKQHIQERLAKSSIFITLLTDNFFNSHFCMCELGGCWALKLNHLPIVVPPIDFKDLKGILDGVQSLKIDSEDSLDTVRDIITKRLNIEYLPTLRWNEKRNEFLDIFKNTKLYEPSGFNVSQAALNEVLNDNIQLKKTIEEKENEINAIIKVSVKNTSLKSELKNFFREIIKRNNLVVASNCPKCNLPRHWMTWDCISEEVCVNPDCILYGEGWG